LSKTAVQGEPTECVRVRGDGVNQGDVEEVDRVVRRSCGLSLETYELPPYQMHWPRRNARFMIDFVFFVSRMWNEFVRKNASKRTMFDVSEFCW
jgi:hypothetical protein